MKRSRVRLALFALLVAAFPALGAGEGAKAPPAGPRLVVERDSLDIGVVEAGQDAVATFVLRNEGDAPLHVLKAKPS